MLRNDFYVDVCIEGIMAVKEKNALTLVEVERLKLSLIDNWKGDVLLAMGIEIRSVVDDYLDNKHKPNQFLKE